jgi:hypothetical protein
VADETTTSTAPNTEIPAGQAADAATTAPAAAAAKPADDQSQADGTVLTAKDGDKADKASDAVPDTYAEWKLPEGVVLDQAIAEKATPIFKELGLSQDKAQKLVDLFADARRQAAEQQTAVWTETQQKWVNEAKADKEFGGEKFDENVAVARKAIDRFGSPELKAALAATGAGNHPEFIRFAMKVGRAISEDSTMVSGGSAAGRRDVAEILFGSTMTK